MAAYVTMVHHQFSKRENSSVSFACNQSSISVELRTKLVQYGPQIIFKRRFSFILISARPAQKVKTDVDCSSQSHRRALIPGGDQLNLYRPN